MPRRVVLFALRDFLGWGEGSQVIVAVEICAFPVNYEATVNTW